MRSALVSGLAIIALLAGGWMVFDSPQHYRLAPGSPIAEAQDAAVANAAPVGPSKSASSPGPGDNYPDRPTPASADEPAPEFQDASLAYASLLPRAQQGDTQAQFDLYELLILCGFADSPQQIEESLIGSKQPDSERRRLRRNAQYCHPLQDVLGLDPAAVLHSAVVWRDAAAGAGHALAELEMLTDTPEVGEAQLVVAARRALIRHGDDAIAAAARVLIRTGRLSAFDAWHVAGCRWPICNYVAVAGEFEMAVPPYQHQEIVSQARRMKTMTGEELADLFLATINNNPPDPQ